MSIFNSPKTRFISHRGFTPLAPENSLPSFYYAGLLGQWAIETDVHVTKDGQIVCCHNDAVDKYCNGTGKISELDCKELRGLEIVSGNRVECFSAEEKRIPLFSEYLEICRRFGSIPFIELKTDDTERVLRDLKQSGFSENEAIMSATVLERLKETRRCAKNMFVHWIFAREERLHELSSLGNAGLSWRISDPFACEDRLLALAREGNLRLCLRAADKLTDLEQMKRLGLDYFPTNQLHD